MVCEKYVAIGKHLWIVLIVKYPFSNSPDNRTLRVHFNDEVEIPWTNQRVAIRQSGDGIGMSPALVINTFIGGLVKVVFGIPGPNNLSFGIYFLHLSVTHFVRSIYY